MAKRLARRLTMATLAMAIAVGPAAAIVGPSTDGSAVAPYVVMVLNHVGRVAGYCSGLVVAQNAVLTAAHCLPPGAAVKVHFRDAQGEPVLLDVAEIVRSPGYRADAIKARLRSVDLALIRLPSPLPDRFHAANLGEAAADVIGQRFRLAGFGLRTEGQADSSGQLRIGEVAGRTPLSSLLLWADDPLHRGTGACTGDSGGPVFAAQEDRVLALMAWSAGAGAASCGSLTQAVWLGPQRAWIDDTLSRWAPAAR